LQQGRTLPRGITMMFGSSNRIGLQLLLVLLILLPGDVAWGGENQSILT